MDKFYFVYKTTNLVNNHIYIGVHETFNVDDGYLGSGKLLKQAIEKYGKESFKREILKFFDSKTDAFLFESELVNSVFIKRDDVYNLTEGGKGVITHSSFGIESIKAHAKNKVVAKDLLTNSIVKISKFEFDSNPDRYKGHTVGKKVMKDSNGTIVVTNEHGSNLSGITKGYTKVLDENNKIILVKTNDEKIKSGIYQSFSKGKVVVKDANGNKFTVDQGDPRLLTKELVGVASGKRHKQNKKRNTLKCPNCNKEGDSSNMKRWHFENCKNITKI